MRLVFLLLLLAAPAAAADKLRVVATTADVGALATAVGGDAADVTTLARPTEDPHFVDPKPSFIKLLNQADVLIEGGAALEAGWLPPLLESARNPRIAVGAKGRVVASAGIALRDVPTALDRALGDIHPYGNPHYLLDPENAKVVAQTIGDAFCACDGTRCERWRTAAGALKDAVDAKLPAWQAALAPAKGAAIVTYHKDFDYLAARFGLEVLDDLEPKPGIPPSPTHLAALVPRMQAAKVKVVAIEPYRERQTADFVAEKTGARVLVLPIMPGGPEAKDYVDLIDHDVRALAKALAP